MHSNMNTIEMRQLAAQTSDSIRTRHAIQRRMRIKKDLEEYRRSRELKEQDWPPSDRAMDDDIYD